jgi:hypothetical protein
MPHKPRDPDIHELIGQLLAYEPETGVLRWKVDRSPRVRAGDEAGNITGNGYRKLVINKRVIFAHRIAWLLCHGKWPDGYVDHINGVRTDNRIANLRDVSHQANSQNMTRLPKSNKTGVLGVRKHVDKSGRDRFIPFIKLRGNERKLGTYDTLEEAAAVRRAAAAEFYPGFVGSRA